MLKGVYPRIPISYSSDLSLIIKSLLQVDPKNRATIKQLMHMPVMQQRFNEIRLSKAKDYESLEQAEDNLLGTIKLPRNLSFLQERLPKSNYGAKKVDVLTIHNSDSDYSTNEQSNRMEISKESHLQVIQEEETQSGGYLAQRAPRGPSDPRQQRKIISNLQPQKE